MISDDIEKLKAEVERLLSEKIEQEQEWAAVCAERERPLRAEIERLEIKNEQWRKLNSERVDEIAGLIHRLREAATANERLRADNLKIVEIIARNETHYQAAMAMSEKHRKLWVAACAALQSLMKIGPRPWMDGGVSWDEWDAAMKAAEAVVGDADALR
jgi:chromosome segregation ATPase